MRNIIILLHLIIISGNSFAQLSINGQLLNEETNEPIANANIYIIELKKTSQSDENGYFKLTNIQYDKLLLKITCIGYKDTIVEINEFQEPLTIHIFPIEHKINEVIITSDRKPKHIEDISSRIDIVSPKEIKSYPNTNIDNFLQAIPNVYVNRSWGIFSKNSSVTMRGMDGTARVLVLLDGVPLNHSAGGGINWHIIESEEVEKIEILKGPASALYGNNAMGGVINIITKKNKNELDGRISLFGGSYNTIGGNISFGNNFIKNNQGFYWSGNAFYRQGDGYIIVPETDRDSTDVNLALKEYSVNLTTGYRFNKNHLVEIDARIYDDKRDEGIKVYEEDGSYLKYTTQHYRATYKGNINGLTIYANAFYRHQDYFQHSERLNQVGDSYKLYDRNQKSEDYGIWLNMVKKIAINDELSFGLDFKHGSLWAEDIYFTSTDYFERGGDIDFYAVFLQNDLKLLNDKLNISTSLRVDLAQFKNGYLNVEEPTSVTAFESQLSESFHNTNWQNLSPKLAIRYKIFDFVHCYTSVATGFMPPKIDDMVSSRKISNGFKVANPDLKPETLNNYEIGFDFFPNKKLTVNLSTYYSLGDDFQYFVGTRDTVDVDRPVVKRENISKVEIYGIETSITYQPVNYITVKANYTYNHSQIKEFELSYYIWDDLTNKHLSETPPHQAYLGIFFNSRIVNLCLATNYISEMWQNELNTIKLEAYNTVDLRLQKSIKKLNLSLDIQNIFDKQFIDKKGGLAPGRFIIGKIGFHL